MKWFLWLALVTTITDAINPRYSHQRLREQKHATTATSGSEKAYSISYNPNTLTYTRTDLGVTVEEWMDDNEGEYVVVSVDTVDNDILRLRRDSMLHTFEYYQGQLWDKVIL